MDVKQSNSEVMQEYTYIVEKDGKRLGTIKYEKMNSVPRPKDIEWALSSSFPKGSTVRLLIPIDICKTNK